MQTAIRTDIQALRGLAVSMVLLYHAGIGAFGAGFLGVDVFFVISGFLITGLIRREIERGSFSFSQFYFRRAKRLLPAAYTTFLLTALAAPFFLNATQFREFSWQMFGAITYSANIVLMSQSDYFASAAELKPLLHTWSLAIEEQFYLVLPALLVFVPRRRWRGVALLLLAGSLALCLLLVTVKPIATFYLLPMRGWELGIGTLAALAPPPSKGAMKLIGWLFWPSLALLFIVPLWPTGLPHPGADALLVCLATLVLILRQHPLLAHSLPAIGLARIGDFSYSLYLVHWPVFAFLQNSAVTRPTTLMSITALAIAVALAAILYLCVELPARGRQMQPSRRVLAGALAASFFLIGVPHVIAARVPDGQNFSELRRPNDGLSRACVFESDFAPLPECRTSETPSVLVWGDSLAMHLVSGVVNAWEDGVVQATRGDCGPFANLAPRSDIFYLRPWAESCLAFNRSVIDYVHKTPSLRLVVMSSPFRQYLTPFDGKHHWRQVRIVDGQYVETGVDMDNAVAAMSETIAIIRKAGKQALLVAPPPSAGFNAGACVERRALGRWVAAAPLANCDIPVDDYHRFYSRTREFLARVQERTAVAVISFDRALCDERRCLSEIDGVPVYVDSIHLTHAASRLLARTMDLHATLREAAAHASHADVSGVAPPEESVAKELRTDAAR